MFGFGKREGVLKTVVSDPKKDEGSGEVVNTENMKLDSEIRVPIGASEKYGTLKAADHHYSGGHELSKDIDDVDENTLAKSDFADKKLQQEKIRRHMFGEQ